MARPGRPILILLLIAYAASAAASAVGSRVLCLAASGDVSVMEPPTDGCCTEHAQTGGASRSTALVSAIGQQPGACDLCVDLTLPELGQQLPTRGAAADTAPDACFLPDAGGLVNRVPELALGVAGRATDPADTPRAPSLSTVLRC